MSTVVSTKLTQDEIKDYINLLNSMIDEGDGWFGRASGALIHLLTVSGVKLIPKGESKYLDGYNWEYSE